MQIPLTNLYFLLCYAWERPLAAREVEVGVEDCRYPEDLIAKLFVESVEGLIRRGLERGYTEYVQESAAPKGRLLIGPTCSTGILARRQVICARDEFSLDTPANRCLAATLERLLGLRPLSEDIRGRLYRLRLRLPGVGRYHPPTDHPGQVLVHRNNRSYRLALDLCRFILDHSIPTPEGSGHTFNDFDQSPQIMGLVFETFVRRFLALEQSEVTVERERGLRWEVQGSPSSIAAFPRMETDIRLRHGLHRTIVETKFYQRPLRGKKSAPRLRSEHIAQLFIYLQNLHAKQDPKTPAPSGVLLYARVGEPFRFDYRVMEHRVCVRTLDLGADWKSLRDELLALARECASWVNESS